MKSKDRIIIQKIISYMNDIEIYVDGLDDKKFLNDKKKHILLKSLNLYMLY